MRKILLSFLAVLFLLSTRAQVSESEASIARQLVSKNSAAIGLTADDLNNYLVSATYVTREGIRMVYLQQSYQGIPVYNKIHVLAFRDDKVVSVAGDRIRGISKLVNTSSTTPTVDAGSAVRTAFAESSMMTNEPFVVKDIVNRKLDFGRLNASLENVTAELIWVPVNEDKQVKLAWQIFVAPERSDDMWMIRVDANNNKVIEKNNLTVYDSWHKSEIRHPDYVTAPPPAPVFQFKKPAATKSVEETPIVNGASYLVVKYPAESPQHPGGTASLHTDPWTWAPGNATSLKWHSDGANDYTITRGNNVWATEDRAAANQNTGLPATSSTPDPLTFNFPPDYTVAPTTPAFQQFAITNLFYWNNLLHDVTYQYGFDEVSGNFQTNNQGRGGLGNDNVMALAQSGAGTNNANFSTPNDGSRGRMRMYLFTAPNPDRDGDLDNGVVCHEFGHGISNRLTGGPGNSGCLSNTEEGGEGWGDYNALMLTTNWATATVNDGPLARPMGTYVLNQPITGSGIRNYPYSTNIAINPLTYANMGVAPIGTEVHNIGEIWAMALWEMTWEIIKQTNTINPDLLNPAGAGGLGGNSIAFKLVTEGMRLQPCSPGFIDARNAILKADTLFFGSQYSCAIWRAFAKRGMGRGASQGSSNSATDQTPSFVVSSATVKLTESSPTVTEGTNLTYTNTVTADNCAGITNYYVTDTLPAHVTYVSGGTYNAGNRTITFGPITLAAGASQTFNFTVTVNNGTYFAPVTHLNETVPSAGIPAAWTATNTTGSSVWTTSTASSNSAPNAFFAPNSSTQATDLQLATTSTYTLNPNAPANYSTLTFWHRYNTEEGWDGGVIEVSTNGGGSWTDLGSKIVSGKYNGSLGTGSNNPIGGRAAFTGLINSFMKTTVDLSAHTGQAIKIRFRFASDDNTAPANGGWFVDDIVLSSEPAVAMRSSLFNASNVRQGISDTIAQILPAVGCIPASVTTQPSNTSACVGANATFTVTASGTAPTYQWQVNTGSGFNDVPASAPYSGTTTSTLTITGVTAGMNNYIYRVVVSNACTSPGINSNGATLTVNPSPTVTTQPSNTTVCAGSNATFTVAATGATSYQWQVNTGSGFNDIPAGAPYSGITTATLTITGVTAGMNGYIYRAVVSNTCAASVNSNGATLTVTPTATVTSSPSSVSICAGSNTSFTVAATGATSYQWQVNTGSGFVNIPAGAPYGGVTTTTLTITGATNGMDGYQYRAAVTNCSGTVFSNPATLTITSPLSITTQPANVTVCQGSSVSFSVGTSGTVLSYQWQFSTDGGATYTNIPGATNSTYNLGSSMNAQNGYRFRVVVTGGCGPINSNAAILTVNPMPAFSQLNVPGSVCLTDAPFALVANPNTGTWSGTGVSGGIFNPATAGLGSKSVTYTITAAGCTTTATSSIQVNDCSDRHILLDRYPAVTIWPNPNNGLFKIKLNTDLYSKLGVKIFNSAGALVRTQEFSGVGFGSVLSFDISQMPSGAYHLYLTNNENGFISRGESIVVERK